MLLRIFFLLFPAFAFAQHIQGTLTDAQSDFPLTGATIEVIGIDPVLGTTTDLDGRCSLGPVPTGRLTVRISSLGYATQTVPNVLVTAGKDVMLDLALEESVTELAAVTVTAGSEGGRVVNEMSTLSTQSFTAEQVNRFAGGRSDVSRLARRSTSSAKNSTRATGSESTAPSSSTPQP